VRATRLVCACVYVCVCVHVDLGASVSLHMQSGHEIEAGTFDMTRLGVCVYVRVCTYICGQVSV